MTNTPLRPARSAPDTPADAHRRTKRSWLLTAVFASMAAGAGVYVGTGISGETAAPPPAATTGATHPGAAPERAAPAEKLITASEGTLTVTVGATRCGLPTVGPADLPLTPEGEFCLVDMGVRNTGKEPRLLDPGAHRALDDRGRSHRVAEQAAVLLNDRDPSLLGEIPAGESRQGVVPFDVPKGARLTTFVLHKSPHSTGVRVPLTR